VSDFGLSVQSTRSRLSSNTIAGTPRYIAPEVLTGAYSDKSDVYSYGVVLWQMMTRRVPFEEYKFKTDVDLMLSVADHNYRPTLPPWCPPAIARILSACWHRGSGLEKNNNKQQSADRVL
jgi:serine/threonine protein kinase